MVRVSYNYFNILTPLVDYVNDKYGIAGINVFLLETKEVQ